MKYSILLVLVLFSNLCFSDIDQSLNKKNVHCAKEIIGYGDFLKEWIRKERDLMVRIDEDFYLKEYEMAQMKAILRSKIDKQILSLDIKRVIYKAFFQEMGIISGDFSDIAPGNAELAQDLKNLFCISFNRGDELAQEKLDEFCHKWNLEKIEINQAHTF